MTYSTHDFITDVAQQTVVAPASAVEAVGFANIVRGHISIAANPANDPVLRDRARCHG
jgi:hypothetical protein